MHVADGQDIPLVAVFGPTGRELGFYPQGPKAAVVEISDLACRPCSLHGDEKCPRGHHDCMNKLSPEKVIQAARNVTGPGPASG
jgi:heptosyltransferase-2